MGESSGPVFLEKVYSWERKYKNKQPNGYLARVFWQDGERTVLVRYYTDIYTSDIPHIDSYTVEEFVDEFDWKGEWFGGTWVLGEESPEDRYKRAKYLAEVERQRRGKSP